MACGNQEALCFNAEIMIHQPLGRVQGQATDIILAADNIKRPKNISHLFLRKCNKPVDILLKDMERDYVMTSKEALSYGLIDNIGFPKSV